MAELGKFINKESVYVGRVSMIGSTVRSDGLMPLADEGKFLFGYMGQEASKDEQEDILSGNSRVLKPVSGFRLGPYIDREAWIRSGELKMADNPPTLWFQVPRILKYDPQTGEINYG